MLDGLLPPSLQRSSMEAATAMYEQNVMGLASYLDARGVDEVGARSFRLGLISEPAVPEHDRFVGMMSVPYLSKGGVLALKFRCLEQHDCKAFHHGKYDQPSGQKLHLFNVNALLSGSDTVILCEGELSAIVSERQLGVPTVATPGTQWAKEHPHWPRCFGDVERVIVVADHDITDDEGKGIAHAKRVHASLPNSELVLPPKGMDLDEWILADGPEAVRERLHL